MPAAGPEARTPWTSRSYAPGIRDRVVIGATGTFSYGSDRAADGRQLAVVRVDVSDNELPDAAWPAPPVTRLEADPRSTCKFVLGGTPPTATDCLNRPLLTPDGRAG